MARSAGPSAAARNTVNPLSTRLRESPPKFDTLSVGSSPVPPPQPPSSATTLKTTKLKIALLPLGLAMVADPLLAKVLDQDLAAIDEDRRLAVEGIAERLPAIGRGVEEQVEDEDDERRDQARDEGRVLADHRVLDRVRDDQEHDEIERRELAGLALAFCAGALSSRYLTRAKPQYRLPPPR